MARTTMSPTQKRSRNVYSTPTSLSLEKLMMDEMDYTSSDFNTSGGISSRSSLSAQDSADDAKALDPPSWSFEGEQKSARKMKKKPDKLKRSDSPPDEHNVGRCVIGCAADCTALCCCPLTVFHILAVLCYKFPVSVCRKVSRALKAKKKGKPTARLRSSKSFSSSEETWSAPVPSVAAASASPTSPISLPASIQQRFGFGGQHLWGEFDSSLGSP